MTSPRYWLSDVVHENINVFGSTGNSFVILGKCRSWLEQLDATPEEIRAFVEEAKSADYEQLLGTVDRWFGSQLREEYEVGNRDLEPEE